MEGDQLMSLPPFWLMSYRTQGIFNINSYYSAQQLRSKYLLMEIYQHLRVYFILKCAGKVQRSV